MHYSLSPVLRGEGWGEGLGLKLRSSPNRPSPYPLSTGERGPERTCEKNHFFNVFNSNFGFSSISKSLNRTSVGPPAWICRPNIPVCGILGISTSTQRWPFIAVRTFVPTETI